MLTAILLESFKSYRSAKLPLASLTVLIGANASGKSNAIEGMRLLSWLAQGQRLSSIQYAIQSGDQVVRGTIEDLAYEKGQSFQLGVETSSKQWNCLSMKMDRRPDGLHICAETLTDPNATVPLYTIVQQSKDRGTDVAVAYNNFASGQHKPQVICSDQAPIFSQLMSPATFEAKHKQSRERIPTVVKKLEQWISSILFLDPVPARMRDYSFPSEEILQGDGRNLSAVLYNLWEGLNTEIETEEGNKFDVAKFNRDSILGFIQSLPEQDITDIAFLKEPRGGVMVQLRESFGGHSRDMDASLLSDGTLRVLSIAAAMLSAPVGSLVVIEEIDNGVHPNRARKLLSSIQQLASKRELRVLLSTHNPALLDALPDSALPDVVFCYRATEDGSSRLVRLQDLQLYPELIAQDSLGGLVTSGALERFVKQPQSSDRQSRSLAWLEKLEGDEQL